MKTLMWKNPILLKNFRKDQRNAKASFPSNVLIVEKLGTFKPNFLLTRKNMKMKMTKTNNTRKRENSTIRKSTKEKRICSKEEEEDNSSSEVSDNDDEVLFLGIEESNEIEENEHKEESEDEEEVNVEE